MNESTNVNSRKTKTSVRTETKNHKNPKPVKQRKPNSPRTQLEIFADAAKYAKNNRWKKIFMDMSGGVNPVGVSTLKIEDGTLSLFFRDNGKKYVLKHEISDGQELCEFLVSAIKLIESKSGKESDGDEALKEKPIWKNIKKNIKEELIAEYVSRKRENRNEKDKLYYSILLGMKYKNINDGDIIFGKEGKIKRIVGYE